MSKLQPMLIGLQRQELNNMKLLIRCILAIPFTFILLIWVVCDWAFLKKNEKEFKEGKERIRKMRITNMWVGWIMGFVTIVLVTTIVIREFMSVTPNMLVIVIDIFAFFMSINLIYQSFKTRHELRKQIQEELLEELEKD